jgi:hypothetical protein
VMRAVVAEEWVDTLYITALNGAYHGDLYWQMRVVHCVIV